MMVVISRKFKGNVIINFNEISKEWKWILLMNCSNRCPMCWGCKYKFLKAIIPKRLRLGAHAWLANGDAVSKFYC